jgi:hypothetical protein
MQSARSRKRSEAYLEPYRRAADVHGAGFGSLLWASVDTQERRFDALARLCDMGGKRVLDAGCGRGDLLPFLMRRGVYPAEYRGVEAVEELAAAADCMAIDASEHLQTSVVLGDFVRNPALLDHPADVLVLSGSLNTLEDRGFYATLDNLLRLPWRRVGFNFLSSPKLAGVEWLYWREPCAIMDYLKGRCAEIAILEDYLEGDCTVAVRTT